MPAKSDHSSEFVLVCLADVPRPPHPLRWGPWRLTVRTNTLDIRARFRDAGTTHYWIDLDDCTSSAQVLDWVCQISGKSWGTPYVVGQLIRAFDALLRPQQNLCSWGDNYELTVSEIRDLVRDYVQGAEVHAVTR